MGRGKGMQAVLDARAGQGGSLEERTAPEHIAGQSWLCRSMQRGRRQFREWRIGRHGLVWLAVVVIVQNSARAQMFHEFQKKIHSAVTLGGEEDTYSYGAGVITKDCEGGSGKGGPSTPSRPAFFLFCPNLPLGGRQLVCQPAVRRRVVDAACGGPRRTRVWAPQWSARLRGGRLAVHQT